MSRPTDRGPIFEPGIFSFWSWAPRGVHSTKGGSVCPSGWIAKEEEDRCDQPFPPQKDASQNCYPIHSDLPFRGNMPATFQEGGRARSIRRISVETHA